MNSELVFNIWFIVDIGSDLSKFAIIKPYYINGNDEEKTSILKILAETDYLTSERIDFAENTTMEFENITIEGYVPTPYINQFFDLNKDFFVNTVEKQLPPVLQFKGGYIGENKAIPQKFPNNPLFVQTILMENEYGELRPYTKMENKEWYETEKIRIEYKSKGMQN